MMTNYIDQKTINGVFLLLRKNPGIRYDLRTFFYNTLGNYPQNEVNSVQITGYYASVVGRNFVKNNFDKSTDIEYDYLQYICSDNLKGVKLNYIATLGVQTLVNRIIPLNQGDKYNIFIQQLHKKYPDLRRHLNFKDWGTAVQFLNLFFVIGFFTKFTIQGVIAETQIMSYLIKKVGSSRVSFVPDQIDKDYGIDIKLIDNSGNEMFLQVKSTYYKRNSKYGIIDIKKNEKFEKNYNKKGSVYWLEYVPHETDSSGRMKVDISKLKLYRYNDSSKKILIKDIFK